MRICLCGSARFERDFKHWNKVLSLFGHTVYSLAVYPSDESGKDWYTPEQKVVLDQVHFNKIFFSEAILVLNVDGYIGTSTQNEINFARGHKRQVFSLNHELIEGSKPVSILLENAHGQYIIVQKNGLPKT